MIASVSVFSIILYASHIKLNSAIDSLINAAPLLVVQKVNFLCGSQKI